MIYFTSDFHLGHHNIIDLVNRPFNDIEDMNKKIVDNINIVLENNNIVYHLGDFAFANSENQIESYLNQISNYHNITFIVGNHDKYLKKYLKRNCIQFYDYLELKHNNSKYVLCHYPIESWNGKFHGVIHLHGHTHGTLSSTDSNRLDVGIDTNNFKPYLINDIDNIVTKRFLDKGMI
jgi:calcineurin-like phosphoesterase family protein